MVAVMVPDLDHLIQFPDFVLRQFSMSSTLFDRLFDFVCERFGAAVLIKEFRSRPGVPSS